MTAASLDWPLADFARETPGVTRAVVVSADGLRLATSPDMTVELGDQLSAAASGLVSLAKGAARLPSSTRLSTLRSCASRFNPTLSLSRRPGAT